MEEAPITPKNHLSFEESKALHFQLKSYLNDSKELLQGLEQFYIKEYPPRSIGLEIEELFDLVSNPQFLTKKSERN